MSFTETRVPDWELVNRNLEEKQRSGEFRGIHIWHKLANTLEIIFVFLWNAEMPWWWIPIRGRCSSAFKPHPRRTQIGIRAEWQFTSGVDPPLAAGAEIATNNRSSIRPRCFRQQSRLAVVATVVFVTSRSHRRRDAALDATVATVEFTRAQVASQWWVV